MRQEKASTSKPIAPTSFILICRGILPAWNSATGASIASSSRLYDQVAQQCPWRILHFGRTWAVMTNSVDVRAQIVNVFRRDLIGPGPQDADLAKERLNESPARWYLAGFLAPAEDSLSLDGEDDETDPSAQEEMEIDVEEPDADG